MGIQTSTDKWNLRGCLGFGLFLSSRKELLEGEYSPLLYDVFDCGTILDHRGQAQNGLHSDFVFYEENISVFSATFTSVVLFEAVSTQIHKVYQKMDQMLETKQLPVMFVTAPYRAKVEMWRSMKVTGGRKKGNIAIFCSCALLCLSNNIPALCGLRTYGFNHTIKYNFCA